MKKTAFLVFVFLLLQINFAQAQDSIFSGKRHKIGFNMGFGDQEIVNLNVPYFYEVNLFQMEYFYSWVHKKSWSLDLMLQPQLNFVSYRPINTEPNEDNGFEFGLNGGVMIRKNFFKDAFGVYMMISSGPHFISGAPARQRDGFIFSDNLVGGIHIRCKEGLYLDLRGGFRHISNAGLSNPNGGVNNVVVNVGMFACFERFPFSKKKKK